MNRRGAVISGWRLAVGVWRLAVGGWRLAVGENKLSDSRVSFQSLSAAGHTELGRSSPGYER